MRQMSWNALASILSRGSRRKTQCHGDSVKLFMAMSGLIMAGTPAVGAAQGAVGSVQWTAVLRPATGATPGVAIVELSGELQSGWHVYGLVEPPNGPTALKVGLDDNAVARSAGAVSGSPAEHKFDASFGLTTEFYSGPFKLYLPVRLAPAAAGAGPAVIPVSVRFQTCNGDICVPPRTIHLKAPLEAGHG